VLAAAGVAIVDSVAGIAVFLDIDAVRNGDRAPKALGGVAHGRPQVT
jgi:hypothetical protein